MSQLKVIERDAALEMKRQRSKRMKRRGKKEIVGAPVMIRPITKAMAGVVHVCCLYPGTQR